MKNLTQKLNNDLKASSDAKKTLLKSSKKIGIAIKKIVSNLKTGGKIILCGNGGSAADAQHLAAEFLVRLKPNFNRSPLPALTLATDTSTITACGNDYKFSEIFSRNLEALGKKSDILIVISTSGNSKNIIEVLKKAKQLKIFSIGFLGNSGGKAKSLCNLPIIIESKNTARIQEAHIFLGHFVMLNVEDLFFKKKDK